MTQRRWMSLNDVFEQLEEEETRHVLQLWEREQEEPEETEPEHAPVFALAPRRRVTR